MKMEQTISKTAILLDYTLIFTAILVNLTCLYLLLLYFDLPILYIQKSDLHQIIFLGGILLALLVWYRKYLLPGWNVANALSFARDFLLTLSLIALPFVLYYSNQYIEGPQIFQRIKPLIPPGYALLLALTLTATVITPNGGLKRLHGWLVKEIESQRMQDDEFEQQRCAQFTNMHPKLVRLPLIGVITTQLFSQSQVFIFGLLLLLICGFILRLWNLDVLAPYTDELNHLIHAKNIASGFERVQQVAYQRSLYTVTVPIAIAYKLFGPSLWVARFVGVFFNMLAIIPLYLLGKRINKPIALLAVGLYVFNPWMIAVARNVREYAYYPVYFYAIALIMFKLYQNVPNRFVIFKDYRKLITLESLILATILVTVVYYVYAIDSKSTFKIILTYYPIFFLLLLRKFDWREKSNKIAAISLLTLAAAGIGLVISQIGTRYITIHRLNIYFLSLFFEKPPQQWYFNRSFISIIIVSLSFLATALLDKDKFTLPFSALVYVSTLLAFSYIFTEGNRPRYSITIEFWHIIVMAAGLFAAYLILNQLVVTRLKWLIWIILIGYFWNVPQSVAPMLYTEPGRHPITDEYHGTLEPAYSFLQENVQPDDVVVISSYLSKNYQLLGGLNTEQIISFNRLDAQPAYDAISSYSSGWIVIDAPRGFDYAKPLPLKPFTHAGKQVDFIGWYGDNYIFRWGNLD